MEKIRSSCRWFCFLGLVLFVLAVLCTICITTDVLSDYGVLLVSGTLVFFSGFVGLAHAIDFRKWNGSFLEFVNAVLRGFIGYLLIRYPFSEPPKLTSIVVMFLAVVGAIRIIGGIKLKLPRLRGSLFPGVASVALAAMMIGLTPLFGVRVIGLALCFDLLMEGASLVGFGLGIRRSLYVATYQWRASHQKRTA